MARWRSEAEAPAPRNVVVADDRMRAEDAFRRMKAGTWLLYTGDFQNARQLLAAVGRRVSKPARRAGGAPASLKERFLAERRARSQEHAVLSRLLVPLDVDYRVALRRGPDARDACEHLWGSPDAPLTVVSLRELLGMMGAEAWRQKGVEVPGLPGRIHPHYGVFSPTRPEYPALLAEAPPPEGKRVFDLGTGTGVLSFLLLARGARNVVATDIEPRAVACANDNASRLGYADRFEAIERPLYPEGRADLVICNPPWVPEVPRTRIDRAIYDPDGAMLRGFLQGLPMHLEPGGEGWLLLSDLAERLGLREPGALDEQIAEAGLRILWTREAAPAHGRAQDRADPLHEARSQERTRLIALAPR